MLKGTNSRKTSAQTREKLTPVRTGQPRLIADVFYGQLLNMRTLLKKSYKIAAASGDPNPPLVSGGWGLDCYSYILIWVCRVRF